MNRLLILLFFYTVSGVAQDSSTVYSVYFDSKTKPDSKQVIEIDSKYYHKYSLVVRNELDLRAASGDNLTVDASGIYLEKNRLLTISRTEIRENPAYHLSDGYLHGVLPNDSVLVTLDGEQCYFLIPKKTYLYEAATKTTQLYQGRTPNEYLILSPEENGTNSILMVHFSANQITLSAIDLEQTVFDFKAVTGKINTADEIPVYILAPSKTEWKEILNHFIGYDIYRIEES